MNSDNSVNAEVKRPTSLGCGCIAALIYIIVGTSVGFIGGQYIGDVRGTLGGAIWLAGLYDRSEYFKNNGCGKKTHLEGSSCNDVACWNRAHRGGFGWLRL